MRLRANILLIAVVAFGLNAKASAPYLTLDSGNAAYAKGNYDKAISCYTSFLGDEYQSAQVYYNLGNCYYRKTDYAKAILNYEKAKKLNPSDADIQFNLQLANAKVVDKIAPDSNMFLTNWWHSFTDVFSERGWGMLSILFLILGLLSIVGYLMSRSLFIRQIGFWGGMMFIVFSLLSFTLARQQYNILTTHDTAIAMNGSITVKGSPQESATQLFVIHEGAKVFILKSEGLWTEIKLANGNQGWLHTADIEAI